MTFSEVALDSARRYYSYLKKNFAGVITYNVTAITRVPLEPFCFVLTLDKKPMMFDTLQVRIKNIEYTQSEIKPLEFDSIKRTLKISLQEDLINELLLTDLKDITVFSDLKFLVERVGNWYKSFGTFLRIPETCCPVSPFDSSLLTGQASANQKIAINAILTEPFTYIWGAPGTGKTRFVLARALLAYVNAGKKVLITAPTNNAVEQSLRGLLPVMREAGLDCKELVIRFGIASSEFASEYPEICESHLDAQALSKINDAIISAKSTLQDYEKTYEVTKQYYELLSLINQFNLFLSAYTEQKESLLSIESNIHIYNNRIETAKAKITVSQTKLAIADKNNLSISNSISKNNTQIQKIDHSFFRRFHQKKRTEFVATLDKLLRDQEEIHLQITSEKNAIESAHTEVLHCQEIVQSLLNNYSDTTQKLIHQASYLQELESHAVRALCELPGLKERLTLFDHYLEEMQSSYNEKRRAFEELPFSLTLDYPKCIDEQKTLIHQLEKQKAETNIHQEEKFKKCLVFAATVDTCLNRLLPNGDIVFSHVFLDEACYCSLIKACTLLSYDCPVTFLGDHMQLPPVCEMDDEHFQSYDKNVFLWAQSALYVQEILEQQTEKVLEDYLNNEPPVFDKLKKYNLTETYRFGEKLANVLAGTVYDETFTGNPEHDTDVFYIHAKKEQETEPRKNTAEIRAITEYCLHHPNEKIGILTPYRRQVISLKTELKNAGLDDSMVLTVHGSQGREWDTILFSTVDTTNKWFTNSSLQKSNGKKVLNTAVSRAKKKLIIVCDYYYWINQKEQLLTKLLNVAQELR